MYTFVCSAEQASTESCSVASVAPGDRGQEQEVSFLCDRRSSRGLPLTQPCPAFQPSSRGLWGVGGGSQSAPGVLLPFAGSLSEQNLPVLTSCPNTCRLGCSRLATLLNTPPNGCERPAGLRTQECSYFQVAAAHESPISFCALSSAKASFPPSLTWSWRPEPLSGSINSRSSTHLL